MKQNPRVRNSFMDPSLLVEIKEAKKFRDLFYHRRESEKSTLVGSEQND